MADFNEDNEFFGYVASNELSDNFSENENENDLFNNDYALHEEIPVEIQSPENPVDGDQNLIRSKILKGCKCLNKNHFNSIDDRDIYRSRLNMRSLTFSERNLAVLAMIHTMMQSSNKRIATYSFTNQSVCREVWLFSHFIDDDLYKKLMQHYKDYGLTPRKHGNTGRPSKTISRPQLSSEETYCIVHFLDNIAVRYGVPHPASDKIFLQANLTKKKFASSTMQMQ